MGELLKVNFAQGGSRQETPSARELRELKRPEDADHGDILEQGAYMVARLEHAIYARADELEIEDLRVTTSEALSMIGLDDYARVYKRATQIQDELSQQSQ
jgi:hypothetical protein